MALPATTGAPPGKRSGTRRPDAGTLKPCRRGMSERGAECARACPPATARPAASTNRLPGLRSPRPFPQSSQNRAMCLNNARLPGLTGSTTWTPPRRGAQAGGVYQVQPGEDLDRAVQFSSVAQSCPTLCDPMNRSTPGLPVHHQLPDFTQTHAQRVGDAIQPSHPLSSPSPPVPNPSPHQGLFQ